MSATQKPPHAPYTIELGEPVEIRIERRAEDTGDHESAVLIVGEVEFNGDTIGTSIDPLDLGDVTLEYAVDEMVAGLARYVWHELGGTPTFREEDSGLTGRVEVQAPWERETRTPTLGLIANPEVLPQPETLPEPEQPVEARGQDDGASPSGAPAESEHSGSASVSMTPEEMALVARGEMPESFLGRVVAAMPSGELLDQIESYVEDAYADVEAVASRAQAMRALRELRGRLEG